MKVEQSVLIKVTLQSAEKRIEIRGSPEENCAQQAFFQTQVYSWGNKLKHG
jgi:hypothetical protein